MIETMKLLPEYMLKVAGEGDISNELRELTKKLKLENRVEFTGRLPLEELKKMTRKAHLGISLEEDRGLNYRFALPNKLFDYIQAEIPVIVSDLPEMRNVVETYHVGEVLFERTPQKIAELINKTIENDSKYKENLTIAAKELCWENEEQKLMELFKTVT